MTSKALKEWPHDGSIVPYDELIGPVMRAFQSACVVRRSQRPHRPYDGFRMAEAEAGHALYPGEESSLAWDSCELERWFGLIFCLGVEQGRRMLTNDPFLLANAAMANEDALDTIRDRLARPESTAEPAEPNVAVLRRKAMKALVVWFAACGWPDSLESSESAAERILNGIRVECPRCGGRGVVGIDGVECPECSGQTARWTPSDLGK